MTRADDLAALGLDGEASAPQIRAAYRSQALHHHPDLGGEATEMARISDAYDRLLAPQPAPRPEPAVVTPEDEPDDFTIGHSMLAFVVVPVVLAIILMFGVFSVLSTVL